MSIDPLAGIPAMTEEELANCAERAEFLPEEDAGWVTQVLLECRRARSALESAATTSGNPAVDLVSADLTQVVLDTAEWLRTLWEVGYMGANTLPVPPHAFPADRGRGCSQIGPVRPHPPRQASVAPLRHRPAGAARGMKWSRAKRRNRWKRRSSRTRGSQPLRSLTAATVGGSCAAWMQNRT